MHLAVSPTGFIQPCCRFKISGEDGLFLNIKDTSLERGRKAPGFLSAQNDFSKGLFPAGCSSCKIEEENGIQSMRQKAIEDSKAGDDLTSVEFYLGNACNMKCRSCSPLYSSRWEQEGVAMGLPKMEKPKVNVAQLLSSELSKNLTQLKLLGGEPFYIRSFYEIISNLVRDQVSSKITLELSSNVSLFPEQEVLEQLRTFQKVQLSLSIDDIEKRAEYLRSGTDWQIVSQNLSRWLEFVKVSPNFDVSVHITVSAYNVLHIDSVVLYLHKMGWRDLTIMSIKDPTELSPLRIPLEQRLQAWKRMDTVLKDISPKLRRRIEKILSLPEELPIADFFAYSQKMDLFRGESLETYWSNGAENTEISL